MAHKPKVPDLPAVILLDEPSLEGLNFKINELVKTHFLDDLTIQTDGFWRTCRAILIRRDLLLMRSHDTALGTSLGEKAKLSDVFTVEKESLLKPKPASPHAHSIRRLICEPPDNTGNYSLQFKQKKGEICVR